MSEPTYRQAAKDDVAAIAAVARALQEELGEASGLAAQLTSPEGAAQRIASYGERGAAFVCIGDEGMYAFAIVGPDPQEEGCGGIGVWVLPRYRRQGIGRELALMALEFARAAGYAKVRGTIPQGNEPALSFFGEIGALAQVMGRGMQYELPL